jgi:uncharacterized protein
MSATDLKQRLRGDLKAAMQTGAKDEVRLLRALVAALDNAEAVPMADEELRRFDAAGDVARRHLDEREVAALLARERGERLAAAASFEKLGQDAEALRLRSEAALVARYE